MRVAVSVGVIFTPVQGGKDLGKPPEGLLPADAYQEPVSEGDEGYWFTASGGYYQEPSP